MGAALLAALPPAEFTLAAGLALALVALALEVRHGAS